MISRSRKVRLGEGKQIAKSHTARNQVWIILIIVLLTIMAFSFILSLRFALGAECRVEVEVFWATRLGR